MSDYHCKVVRLANVEKHPNANTLSIADAGGYPVIFRTGDYSEGDLAAYIPVDSVVPDTPDWAFLNGARRIKAKRLRGIFSMGMLTKAPDGLNEGDDCMQALGIERYQSKHDIKLGMNTENEVDPGFLPVYTDIESYRRHKNILVPGEEVVITEKVHGANARFLYRDDKEWVGSHHCIKRMHADNIWWKAARNANLWSVLHDIPNIALYGEIFGQVQDLKYGRAGVDLVFFDALDTKTNKYLDYDDFVKLTDEFALKRVPELYRGPWEQKLLQLAEGPTVIGAGLHTREGIVIRPTKERYERKCGRVILKMVGEGYLLRKNS